MRAIFAIVLGTAILSAVPASAKCSPGAKADDFCGSDREPAKTSYVHTGSGALARFERYRGISDLIRLLAADQAMRNKYKPFPDERVHEEMHNVVVRGYVVAVKPCESDRDFHVILKDEHASAFMNVEVSGLPRDGRGSEDFKRARTEIGHVLSGAPTKCGSYSKLKKPVHVEVKGAVFFDHDHGAGCPKCPGTKGQNPKPFGKYTRSTASSRCEQLRAINDRRYCAHPLCRCGDLRLGRREELGWAGA